jgi:hypothetical protein
MRASQTTGHESTAARSPPRVAAAARGRAADQASDDDGDSQSQAHVPNGFPITPARTRDVATRSAGPNTGSPARRQEEGHGDDVIRRLMIFQTSCASCFEQATSRKLIGFVGKQRDRDIICRVLRARPQRRHTLSLRDMSESASWGYLSGTRC